MYDNARQWPGVTFWIAATALFAVALSPHEVTLFLFNSLLDRIYASPELSAQLQSISGKFFRSTREEFLDILVNSIAVPTKKLLFIGSLAVLAYPVVRGVSKTEWVKDWALLQSLLKRSVVIFFGLAFLVTPIGLKSLGDGYGRMSLAPYAEPAGLFSRRFLAPALAEFLGMSGYVYFFIFSLAIAFGVVFLLILWLNRAGIELGWLPLLSLCTSSFVIFNFEMPGYVDQMMILLALLMAVTPLSSAGILGIVALAMATHELSLVIFVPLIMLFASRTERAGIVILMVIYGSLFVLLNTAWFGAISNVHGSIPPYGKSPLQFFVEEPGLTALGILASHKLLWLIPLLAIGSAIRANRRQPAFSMAWILAVPLLTLPFAIDTSRLMGWGFAGVLLGLLYFARMDEKFLEKLKPLFLFNLVIPSVYVGLNTGPLIFPGLYRILYGWLW